MGGGARPRPARRPQGPGARPGTRGPRRSGWKRTLGLFTLVALIAVLITGGIVYASLASSLPDPDATKAKGRDQSSVIYDAKGRVITRVYAEQNRNDLTLSRMPLQLRQAVIATEDQRFYEHSGVDPLGIARAIFRDVVLRKKSQGGSTITQQYVKNAFVTHEKTLKRKVLEAMLANRVEKRYSKDRILELYLNTIYFGHGAYGVEAASQAYFGKSATALSLPEAATIAGIIKSPGLYSPYIDPAAAVQRRNTVLGQMREQGYITDAEFTSAKAVAIKPAGLKGGATLAPYFVEFVKDRIATDYGQESLYRGGLQIYTTIDLDAQTAAEKAVTSTLNRPEDPSAAIVAIRPGTGEILAMVGGRDFKTQQFNAAVQGKGRQPGSSFKPFVLATALAEGVSPEQTFESGPAKLAVGSQVWSVTGASGGRKGPMRLRQATEQSVNSVFAQLILQVGPEKVVKTAEKMGLRAGITPVPAIALGGLEQGVTPLEMADAYATLAAGGMHAAPYGISKVVDSKGKTLFEAKPKADRALDEDVAYLTTDVLKGVIANGTGHAAAIGRPAAGKTGTTQENRDAWFVGYTPQIAAAVWVGYPDSQRAMKSIHGKDVTGGSFPAQIWAKFMKPASAKLEKEDFKKPAGIAAATICLETGQLATEFCPTKGPALFLGDKLPVSCTKHAAPEKITMPNLLGMTKEAALALLQKLKLMFKVIDKDVSGVAAGIVAQQTPVSGSIATSQTVVSITVSTGGVGNQAPKADFTMPTQVRVGEAVALDGSSSTDDGKIVKWYWELGNGKTAEGVRPDPTKLSYSAIGTYELTLWVTDDHGQQGSVTKRIRVVAK